MKSTLKQSSQCSLIVLQSREEENNFPCDAMSFYVGNPCDICGKISAESQKLRMHLVQVQQLNCDKSELIVFPNVFYRYEIDELYEMAQMRDKTDRVVSSVQTEWWIYQAAHVQVIFL